MFLAEMQLGPIAIEDPKRFLAQVLGFLLLFIVLWFVNVPVLSRPHVRGLLVDREVRVEEVHNQISTAIVDTQKVHDDYADRLKNIEAEAKERIAAAVREADAVHVEIIADAKEAAAYVKRRTEEELSREQTRQRILLRRKIVELSLDAAEASVGTLNSDAVQRSLISDFIATTGISGTRMPETANG